MSFVTSTVQDIEGRLAELQGEVTRLESAKAILVGGETPAPAAKPAAPAKSNTRRPGRPAGSSKVNRADQALGLVQAQPGIKIPALATAMSIEPNYLYRVLPKLAKEGQVAKDENGGWVPAGTPAA